MLSRRLFVTNIGAMGLSQEELDMALKALELMGPTPWPFSMYARKQEHMQSKHLYPF